MKYIYLGIVFLIFGCANIKPPTGGPRDQKPPELLNSRPKNNETNFQGKTLYLEFNEYVKADKIYENLIVSPLKEGTFDVIARKKTIIVKFDEPFNLNTTYNIFFGESIKDATEGNPIRNLSLSFSTGEMIDTLKVEGTVSDFIKGNGLPNISVEMYSTADTGNIVNARPLYFTRTDKKGSFTFNNVKQGNYIIYALKDQNQNFKFDSEKEDIGYIEKVAVDSSLKNINIGITRTDTKGPDVISRKQEFDYYLLTFNEGVESYTIKNETAEVISELSDDGKKVKVFNTFAKRDSVDIVVTSIDSTGNIGTDSLRFKINSEKQSSKKDVFSFRYKSKNNELSPGEDIHIVFNRPLKLIDYSKIRVKKDTTVLKTDSTSFILSNDKLNLKLPLTFKFKDSLIITAEKGAFINIANDSNTFNKSLFRYKNEENFGIIAGKVKTEAPNYIFQVLNKDDKIVFSEKNIKEFKYNYLEPGSYKLRVIVDSNNNGHWDPLDFKNNIPPETIVYYPEKINLRANWEMLDISFIVK